MKIAFRLLPGLFAVARLAPDAPMPDWCHHGDLISITRTKEELSIVCAEPPVPAGVVAERGWRILKLKGPFPLNTVGVLAAFAAPLAAAGVSVLPIGTFDTDYVLVHSHQLDRALAALAAAGHLLEPDPRRSRRSS